MPQNKYQYSKTVLTGALRIVSARWIFTLITACLRMSYKDLQYPTEKLPINRGEGFYTNVSKAARKPVAN
jgi:hypothetical protein